jgi:chromate transporter
MNDKPSSTLLQLARAFVRFANATFGGDSATIAVLQRALVRERAWIEPKRFTLINALARLTPGTNVLAVCTGLGWQLKGWRGAAIALLAASIPCSVIVLLVSYSFDQISHNRIAQLSIRGALAAAVGIIAVNCWTVSKPYLESPQWLRATLISLTAFALAVLFGISPIRILLTAAAVGFFMPVRSL